MWLRKIFSKIGKSVCGYFFNPVLRYKFDHQVNSGEHSKMYSDPFRGWKFDGWKFNGRVNIYWVSLNCWSKTPSGKGRFLNEFISRVFLKCMTPPNVRSSFSSFLFFPPSSFFPLSSFSKCEVLVGMNRQLGDPSKCSVYLCSSSRNPDMAPKQQSHISLVEPPFNAAQPILSTYIDNNNKKYTI